ncbi:MAG: hypothetical protein KBT04_07370 [Bacteroidales bacterium]|nr:hypothetical protein [Candidatus Colimorpha onthohippi]
MQQRIDFIDLAKGVCILLVVLNHAQFLPYHLSLNLSNACSAFRIPFYFFLSGLFF